MTVETTDFMPALTWVFRVMIFSYEEMSRRRVRRVGAYA